MRNLILFVSFFLIIIMVIQSCKKDKQAIETDKQLYSEIGQSGYSYYRNGNILSAASQSPHGSFKLRFNSTALAALDSTGKLPSGGVFPSGSIIVKDVYSGNNLSLYAVMKKDPSNSSSGSGWLWAEYETDGTAKFSVSKRGNGCISCHSGTPNRDLVRTFDLH